MKNDSDAPKPKLKLSLPKKQGDDDETAQSLGEAAKKTSRKDNDTIPGKLSAGRKKTKADPDVVEPIEIEPAEEVFWEVFEMDNLGFADGAENSTAKEQENQPLPAENKPDAATDTRPKSSLPLSKSRPKPPPPATRGSENAQTTGDIDESFFFDEDQEEAPPALPFGEQMLIGDSEDQIAKGPGQLTPEDERPQKPPPPLDAPVVPLNPDLLYGETDEDSHQGEPEEQDEFDFLVKTEFDDVRKSEKKKQEAPLPPENSRLIGNRLWVGIGLVAAIAGATAFTLSMKRESRPVDPAPSTRVVSGPTSVIPTRQIDEDGAAAPNAPALLVEASPGLHSPETVAAIQSIIDGFIISVAHVQTSRPRIIINDVTVPVGALLDPATELRLTQIQNDPRILVFEDGAGRTFSREF